MLSFLLPLASKIISDAVAKIPDNEELGEKLVEICLIILKKAVSLTAPRGTAIVWEGRLWHGNGLNRSGAIRSNISTAFLQPWVKPQENHQYSIREEVLQRITNKQKHILGFSPFGTLGGHDGSSVSAADFDPNRESIGILRP